MTEVDLRPYVVLEQLDEPIDDLEVHNLWLIASLEIVLKGKGADQSGIVLRLNSYPNSSDKEGYWAPPNLLFEVHERVEATVGTDRIKAAFDSYLSHKKERLQEALVQLAQSFGLREEILIRRIANEGQLIEVKPSVNHPKVTNAYYTVRFALISADPTTYANLVDAEGRHGFVMLPITPPTMGGLVQEGLDPNGTGMSCLYFLGKPVISGLSRLFEQATIRSSMRKRAIDISTLSTYRQATGLIIAADVSGYGVALREGIFALLSDPEDLRHDYQRQVLSTLETTLTSLGTTQVQSAGDGFIAGYPFDSPTPDVRLKLTQVLNSWRRWTETLESGINRALAKAEVGSSRGLGSRMAICHGHYSWGRINGISSFYPAFEGMSVVAVARLEQGLNAVVTAGRVTLHDGRELTLSKRGHYLVLGPELSEEMRQVAELEGYDWIYHGLCTLTSKEHNSEGATLLEWAPGGVRP